MFSMSIARKMHPVLLALAGAAVLVAAAACGQDEPAATPPEMPASGGSMGETGQEGSGGSVSGMAMPQVYSGTVSTTGTIDAGAGIQVEARIGDEYVSAPATVESDGSYMLVVEPPPGIAAELINEMIEFQVVGMPEVKASQTRPYIGAGEESLDLVFPATAGGSPVEDAQDATSGGVAEEEAGDYRPSFAFSLDPLRNIGAGENIYTINADGTQINQITMHDDNEHPAWSPDGTRIAFTSNRGGVRNNWDLYTMTPDGTDVRRITDTEGSAVEPAWSPDGTRIAFTYGGEYRLGRFFDEGSDIYTINADGTDMRRLTNTQDPDSKPSWSPDGSLIAFISAGDSDGAAEIYTIKPDGTDMRQLTGSTEGVLLFPDSPAWSPDGSRIAFSSSGNIYTVAADGSDVRQVTDFDFIEASAVHPAWLPDGEQIAFSAEVNPHARDPVYELYTIRADGTGLTRVTYSEDFPARGRLPTTWREMVPAVAPDAELIDVTAAVTSGTVSSAGIPRFVSGDGSGRIAFTNVGDDIGIHTSAADGTDLQRLSTGRLTPLSLNWSPDGQRLVIVAFDQNDEDTGIELYSIAADGGVPVRITSNDTVELSPSWSPDGSRIAFIHSDPGEDGFYLGERSDIYTVAPDGTDVRQVTSTDALELYASWSPDGTRILFSASDSDLFEDEDAQLDIFTIAADGTDLRQVTDTPGSEFSPAWSPDGSRIAFVSSREDDEDALEIYTVKPDGTDLQQVTDREFTESTIWSFTLFFSLLQGVPLLNWLPDGEHIGFIGDPESREEFEIFAIKPDGTGLRQVTDNRLDEFGPVWQPLD